MNEEIVILGKIIITPLLKAQKILESAREAAKQGLKDDAEEIFECLPRFKDELSTVIEKIKKL